MFTDSLRHSPSHRTLHNSITHDVLGQCMFIFALLFSQWEPVLAQAPKQW